ncbi:helix-turn-helix transcriptional regulator [Saccharopolyspora sp. 5N708]|uniref:helix-turn-helix transcriptional regulator n=1 Tax=Saccharopolyspora sp. 5N708 TaxID=3457424 RepID=UPI003FD2E0D9
MTAEVESIGSSMDLSMERDQEKRLRVAVWATDPITLIGLTETLTDSLEVFVATDEFADEVDVLLFATDRVTPEALARMREATTRTTAPAVLVTSGIGRSDLLRAVECRVVAVLHRSAATTEQIVNSIRVAAANGGILPTNLLGELLRQVQTLQREVLAPRGLNSVGLTPREIDVVRLLAEGCDTEEIGKRLCYSERTVKYIINAMSSRLKVRNRPQLVAHCLRAGVI